MQNIEEIYKEYFKTVYKYLFCLTSNHDLAEELTQETFYKAVKKIDTYEGKCKISVWLCQIAKYTWYDYLRRKQEIINIDDLYEFKSEVSLEDKIIEEEEKNLIEGKLNVLDDFSKEVVILRIKGDMSFKEIGNVLNKTENWARVTYYRAKNKLKEALKNE
ncbi:MAG: sigma-70 family RNA polymerase sigma factor [Clostridia bacterium]|nr:sigma-70 family RNA polymerase sigma factor [Clostridia bacterium]